MPALAARLTAEHESGTVAVQSVAEVYVLRAPTVACLVEAVDRANLGRLSRGVAGPEPAPGRRQSVELAGGASTTLRTDPRRSRAHVSSYTRDAPLSHFGQCARAQPGRASPLVRPGPPTSPPVPPARLYCLARVRPDILGDVGRAPAPTAPRQAPSPVRARRRTGSCGHHRHAGSTFTVENHRLTE